jgi:hypothetical protein
MAAVYVSWAPRMMSSLARCRALCSSEAAAPTAVLQRLCDLLRALSTFRTAQNGVCFMLVCLDAMPSHIILESLPPHNSPRESVTHIALWEAPQQQRKAEQDSFSAPRVPLCDY